MRAMRLPGAALVATLVSMTASPSRAELPPGAQKSLSQGLDAAKRQEWPKAVALFQQARKAAPGAPEPLLNLGLAEAQMPGHEVRAIAWFVAYRSVDPSAANLAAVGKEVAELKGRVDGEIGGLVHVMDPPTVQKAGWEEAETIARLMVETGQFDNADHLAAAMTDDFTKNSAVEGAIEGYLRRGRLTEAKSRYDSTPDVHAYVAAKMVAAELAAGDYEAAKATVEQTTSRLGGDQRLALAEGANRLGKSGDVDALLAAARETAEREANPAARAGDLADWAVTAFRVGRRADAEAMLRKVHSDAVNLNRDRAMGANAQPFELEGRMLARVATAYARMGKSEDAGRTLREAMGAREASHRANEPDTGIYPLEDELRDTAIIGVHDLRLARQMLTLYYAKYPDSQKLLLAQIDAAPAAFACDKAKAGLQPAMADQAPAARSQAWADYIDACLSSPEFLTDYRSTLASADLQHIATYGSGFSQLVDQVLKPGDRLEDALMDIRQASKRQPLAGAR